jgi:hypothetical protein
LTKLPSRSHHRGANHIDPQALLADVIGAWDVAVAQRLPDASRRLTPPWGWHRFPRYAIATPSLYASIAARLKGGA